MNAESSVKEQWKIIKECILTSAEVAVRYAKKQPDWFIDATDILRPLKARACQRYLQLQNFSAKHEFWFQQRLINRAVDEAKEAWISKVISDAKHCRDGKLRWHCIRKLQTAFCGRQPARSVRFRKQDGSLTMDPMELKQLWYEHFKWVLNVTSQCEQHLINEMPSWEGMQCLDDLPSSAELAAMAKMK